jgi:hypothetical protein
LVFADGFAGAIKQPGQAAHRPTGLALRLTAHCISPTIRAVGWRVTFQGGNNATGIAPRRRRAFRTGLDIRQPFAAGGYPSDAGAVHSYTAGRIAGQDRVGRAHF